MENNTKYLTLFNGKMVSIILPWSFVLCFIVSVALLIAGFLTPPIGIIDGSCLSAVGGDNRYPYDNVCFACPRNGYEDKTAKRRCKYRDYEKDRGGVILWNYY